MRFYYDTEFLENGKTIDLISIGIVAEDGREYYAVSDEFDTIAVAANWWLMKNVMSSIGHETFLTFPSEFELPVRNIALTDPATRTRRQIRDEIIAFVGDETPEWWASYGAYDHVALCQLYGKIIDIPKGWPFLTRDLQEKRREHEKKFKDSEEYLEAFKNYFPRQAKGKHNALDDARHNKVVFDYIEKMEHPHVR